MRGCRSVLAIASIRSRPSSTCGPMETIGRKQHIHPARDRVGHGRRDAAIGHMDEIDAGVLGEQHAEQMPAGADALRAVAQPLGPGLGERDKLGDRFRRARGRHDQDVVERDQRRDRLEVLDRIELQIGVERRVDGMRAGVAHHQQIAVRRRVLDRHRRHVAGGARAVLDDDGLLGALGDLVAPRAASRCRNCRRAETAR